MLKSFNTSATSNSLLEKSLYELDYEMNHRPCWISIPIRGVLD